MIVNPNDKLLSKYGEAYGTCQIQRLFKPASFSLETVPSPSPAGYSKRLQLNINVKPEEHQQHHAVHARNRTPEERPAQSTSDCGRYNKNFRPLQCSNSRYMQFPNPHGQRSPSSATRNRSPIFKRTSPFASASASSMTIRPWSPVKGRVLNWDDA